MAIHLLRGKPTDQQMREMLEAHGDFIKLAVDLRLRVVAGGGEMHADCEGVLLADGSDQDDIWGADWNPDDGDVEFESFINLRPRLGNRSMTVEDPARRALIESVVRGIFQP